MPQTLDTPVSIMFSMMYTSSATDDIRDMERELNFFESRLRSMERPMTPWERGLANAYREMAMRCRRRLDEATRPVR